MRALDLFCGAGGASMGLHRAGFELVGVDIKPQPRYPFEFHQADATTFPLDGYDFIWASPPCQAYSALKGLVGEERPKLIPQVRERLKAAGVLYCIENVVGADLINPIRLCGSSFGLGVWRHRLFEMSAPPVLIPQCDHASVPKPIDVTGTGGPFKGKRRKSGGGVSRKPDPVSHARVVMGIDWMTRRELSEAIPPAFAEFIGHHVMALMNHEEAA